MRIISGDCGGRIITPPKYFKDRPTTDLAKESLFNILANRIDFEQITFLDLFSGTGSISYEMASRGCSNITSVDINHKYVSYINSIFKTIFADKKSLFALKADVLKYIKNSNLNYDLIFADPPYELEELNLIPELIFKNNSLKNNAIIIIEHSKTNDFSTNKYFVEQRKYGKVNFTFFEYKNESEEI